MDHSFLFWWLCKLALLLSHSNVLLQWLGRRSFFCVLHRGPLSAAWQVTFTTNRRISGTHFWAYKNNGFSTSVLYSFKVELCRLGV